MASVGRQAQPHWSFISLGALLTLTLILTLNPNLTLSITPPLSLTPPLTLPLTRSAGSVCYARCTRAGAPKALRASCCLKFVCGSQGSNHRPTEVLALTPTLACSFAASGR